MPALKRIPLELILFFIIVCAQIPFVFVRDPLILNWYASDDAFYYFKIAQNVIAGKGFSFDGINLTNGFHPLWMLLCIFVFAISGNDLHFPLHIIMAISIFINAFTALLVYRLLRKYISKTAALVSGLLIGLYEPFQQLIVRDGMETALSAFCIVLALYTAMQAEDLAAEKIQTTRKACFTAGVAATLALFSRLDNILLVGLLGVWLFFSNWQRREFIFLEAVGNICAILLSFQLLLRGVGFSAYIQIGLIYILIAIPIRFVCSHVLPQRFISAKNMLIEHVLNLALSTLIASLIIVISVSTLRTARLIGDFPLQVFLFDFLLSLLVSAGSALVQTFVYRTHELNLIFNKNQITRQLKLALVYFLPIAVSLFVYLIINKITFNTPTPISGQVKQWWGTLELSAYPKNNMSRALDYAGFTLGKNSPWLLLNAIFNSLTDLIRTTKSTLFWVVSSTFVLAAAWLVKRKPDYIVRVINRLPLSMLLATCITQMMYYSFLGYASIRYWYWIAHAILTLLALGILIDFYLQLFRSSRVMHALKVIGIITLAGVLSRQSIKTNRDFFSTYWKTQPVLMYQDSVNAVRAAASPSHVISAPGSGFLGYLLPEYTVINLDGLVNSKAYFEALKNKTVPDFLASMHIRYVIGHYGMLTELQPYSDFFKGRISLVANVSNQGLFRYFPPE